MEIVKSMKSHKIYSTIMYYSLPIFKYYFQFYILKKKNYQNHSNTNVLRKISLEIFQNRFSFFVFRI